jgi:hypothetical protein
MSFTCIGAHVLPRGVSRDRARAAIAIDDDGQNIKPAHEWTWF